MPPSPRRWDSPRKEDRCTASEIAIQGDGVHFDEEMGALGTLPQRMTTGISDEDLGTKYLTMEEGATHGDNGLLEKNDPSLLISLRILLQPMSVMIWLAIIVEGTSLHYFHVGILLAIQLLHALIRLYGTTKAGKTVITPKSSKRPPAACKCDGICQVVDDPLFIPLLSSDSGIPRESYVRHCINYEDDEVALPAGEIDKNGIPGGESPEHEENTLGSRDTVFVTELSLVDRYGESGVYTGALSDSTGTPNGKGRLDYEKENRWYEGDWIHGRWTGNGRFSNGIGDYFEGGLMNNWKHGNGVMRFADGRVFEGEYIRSQMIQGKMTYKDGSSYEGSWKDGIRHGRGKCIFIDGSEYEGEFQSGNFHGDGQMTWSDGGWYLGEWFHGAIQGNGTEIRPDGTVRHNGEWSIGLPVRRSAKDLLQPIRSVVHAAQKRAFIPDGS